MIMARKASRALKLSPIAWLMRLAITILFLPSLASAITTQELAQLSQKFISKIHLDVGGVKFSSIASIIYGHQEIGYYKARSWHSAAHGSIKVALIAPTYSVPIEFYAILKGGQTLKIGQHQFPSPVPAIFRANKVKVISGKLSHPFYLLNGALPRKMLVSPNFQSSDPDLFRKNHHRFTYLMVVNRLGEIVWLHVPVIDGSLFSSYLSPKEVGRGYYGLMFGKHSGYFEIVKYSGEVMRDFSSKDAETPFVMHHDYETLGAKSLFAVGNEKHSLYEFTKNPAHKDQTFVSDTIIGINLMKGTSLKLTSFTSLFHPGITPYITGDLNGDKKFVKWGEAKADFDFLHINAVDYVDQWGGVLVSFRNISKVGLLDAKFRKLLWSVGSETSDTFTIKEKQDQFRHQHTPFLTSKRRLMLFDNAITQKASRVVEYKLEGKKAKLVWEFQPSPSMFSKDRSSVYPLPNGHFGIYFVKPVIGNQKRAAQPHQDIYMEVNRQKSMLGVMSITFPVASPGYRMIPITSISDDDPTEFTPKTSSLSRFKPRGTPAKPKVSLKHTKQNSRKKRTY